MAHGENSAHRTVRPLSLVPGQHLRDHRSEVTHDVYTPLRKPPVAATAMVWALLAGAIAIGVLYVPTLSRCEGDVICRDRDGFVDVYPAGRDLVELVDYARTEVPLECRPAVIETTRADTRMPPRYEQFPEYRPTYNVNELDLTWSFDGVEATVIIDRGVRGRFTTRYRVRDGQPDAITCVRRNYLAWAVFALITLGIGAMALGLTLETVRRARQSRSSKLPGARVV